MSSKQKKGLRGSIDDDLGDLLGDDDYPAKTPARVSGRGGSLPTRSGKRSLLDDDFFSKLAEEAEKEEASDVSNADPVALLESMKDIEHMDADLFGSKKKPSSAPNQTRSSGTGGLNGNLTKPRGSPVLDEKKPSSAPANTSRSYKKFSFTEQDDFLGPSPDTKDMDDPLADLLDDTMKSKDSRDPDTERKVPPSSGPASTRKVETSSPAQAPKKREELTFDDDEDDLIDALGFRESPTGKGGKLPHKRESEPPQPARTRLDEILGRGTSPRLLERPPTGEKKDPQPEKTPTAKDFPGEEDFTFGSYQPSMASSPGGRHSRRQSVRFSTEDADSQLPEKKPKPVTPLTSTPTHHSKPAADWLGIKQDEAAEEEWPLPAEDSLKPLPSPGPSQGSKPLSSSGRAPSGFKTADIATPHPTAPQLPPRAEPSASKEDDDWLVGALSRKKTQATGKSEEKKASQQDSQGLGDEVDLDQFLSKQGPSPAPRRKVEDTPVLNKEPSSPLHRETLRRQATPPPHSDPVREDRSKPAPQQKQVDENTSVVQPQVMLTAESLQQLLLQQQLAQSQLWGLGGVMDTAALHRQRREMEQQPGELALQARIVQLEGQVRTLQLERDQVQMLLESVQQRHKQDTELMESTHRARVKLLEESSAQREARAQQENEDLAERLAAVTRQTEQERADLQAQYQRRLTQTQQDRDREVERLRELQRKSILEMKKDHEEQVQRLKRLKDEEIDAVTSATSQTRSLTVVIEQMEQFSHRLGDLSSRVESTHENTAQGLELGARQRDEQLRVMQDRLSQQQRAMAEERTRLKEVIAKMDTQLGEQQRQLEKERWRVTAEQAKAESAQRSLEEERRALTQHISMEREELERAKSALLEEQQSVMQRCTEERRKLAAEWAQFHTQEKLRQERAEREASRALERDVHREGSIFSMAQEQADLKLRAGELRQREEAAAKERELMGRQQEELEREKERLSGAALHLTTRAQEVERFSKLASEKYEEGERALQEARQVEAEHQARLRSIHTQMERLRQQEQHLHQERIRITAHRKEVERLRPGIPIGPQLSPAPVLPDFAPVLVSTQVASPMLASQPPASLSSHGSTELQAKLALLRHTAEKDRDFLQDEQFFLETLKKAPYNSAFHTA